MIKCLLGIHQFVRQGSILMDDGNMLIIEKCKFCKKVKKTQWTPAKKS